MSYSMSCGILPGISIYLNAYRTKHVMQYVRPWSKLGAAARGRNVET